MANLSPRAKDALKHSTYWTWFTEWLLAFGGKAAWPILTICTLYMGAELYPGVNLPQSLNFAVFLAQLFALDMGGMGLVSIARQVLAAGHEKEAKEASNFGKVLVTIVIVSLVTVGAKQFCSMVPFFTTPTTKGGHDSIMEAWIDPITMVIEFLLVIGRVVCAVLYGKVMHTLKDLEIDPTPPSTPATPAVDVEALIRQAIEGLTQKFETTLNGITGEQAKLLAAVEQLQSVPQSVPTIDYQSIIGGVAAEFQGRFSQALQQLRTEVERQVQTSITSKLGQSGTPNGTLNGSGKLVPLPTRPRSEKTANLDQTGQQEAVESANAKATVYGLMVQNTSLQVTDIIRITNLPKTTAWRYWDRWHKENPGHRQGQNSATETDHQGDVETAS